MGNKEKFQNLFDEFNENFRKLLSTLVDALKDSGELKLGYSGELKLGYEDDYDCHINISTIDSDDGDHVIVYSLSKIRFNDIIEVFDDEEDTWVPITYFDMESIITILSYIIW